MANSLQSVNVNKSGTCPHGVSPGACPICSGMGGGGLKSGERPQKAGEWSYHHCAMVGNMMRAREARIEEHEKNLQIHTLSVKNFEQNLINLSQKMAEFVQNIQNSMPKFISAPLSGIINTIVVPIIKTAIILVSNLSNILEKIHTKLTDIQDKLNAIFGEAKAFLEKKVSELISGIKSKFNGLFKIFKRNNTKDDETKIDEDKKIFRLKTLIKKILGKKQDDSKDKSRP